MKAGNEENNPRIKHKKIQASEIGAKCNTSEKLGMSNIKLEVTSNNKIVNKSLRVKIGKVSKRIKPIFPKRITFIEKARFSSIEEFLKTRDGTKAPIVTNRPESIEVMSVNLFISSCPFRAVTAG